MHAAQPILKTAIHLAYLDCSGTIVRVSDEWETFQAGSADCGVGKSYFDCCQDEALQADVRALLCSGQTAAFVYSHPQSAHNRRFVVIGLACPASSMVKAIIAHLDITRWVLQAMTLGFGDHLGNAHIKTLMGNLLEPLLACTADALIAHFGQNTPRRREQAGVADKLATLTRRQRQVLSLIGNGDSTNEIAHKLQCSPNTVKRHVGGLLQKLKAKNRMEAVALVNGKITPLRR